MRNLLLSLFLAVAGMTGQTLDLSATKTKLRPGEVTTVTFSLNGTTPTVAALQWTEVVAPTLVLDKRILSPALSVQKQLACATVTCVVFGLNQTLIPVGPVVTANLTVSSTATRGPATVTLSNVIGANSDGSQATLTAGAPLAITILDFADLNGDGVIDAVDLLISVDQILGRSPCGSADLDKDGVCTIKDAQILAFRATTP